MAKLNVNIREFKNAIDNKFVCQFLNDDNTFVSRFQQNQEFIVSNINSPQQLTFDLTDGYYAYDYLKVRVFSSSVSSGVYLDIILTNLTIGCNPNDVQDITTVQQNTTFQQNTTTFQQTTTVPQPTVTLCTDSNGFVIGMSTLNENVQFRLYRRNNNSNVLVEDWTNGVIPFSTVINTCTNLFGTQIANRIRAYGNIGAGTYIIEIRNSSNVVVATNQVNFVIGTTTLPVQNTTLPVQNTTLPAPDTVTSATLTGAAGAQPSWNGTFATESYQKDTNILNLTMNYLGNFKFKFVQNANPNIQSGRVIKIMVNNQIPLTDMGGFLSRTFDIRNGPYLVQMFIADPNDSQFERDQYKGSFSNMIPN